MTMLYPNLCFNEVCYKGTALYMYDKKNIKKYKTVLLNLNISSIENKAI